jgi:hypothetical protein
LTSGDTKSCGCLKKEGGGRYRRDLSGQRFGRLVALVPAYRKPVRGWYWHCRCDCGSEKIIHGPNLTNGDTRSCGCLKKEAQKRPRPGHGRRHGHSPRGTRTPTYESWAAMIKRCTNPKIKYFKYYGGRGIRVCERWRSFENFLADMGERPEGTTIDRYPDKNGNYEPGNCRWATSKEQGRNKRKRRWAKRPADIAA